MGEYFKSSFFQILVFTILTQFLSVYITYKFSFSLLSEEVYEPFGRTIKGSLANSIPIILLLFAFGFFIVLLVKFKKFSFIKALLTAVLINSTFFMNLILFSVIFPDSTSLSWIISIFLASLIFFTAYFKKFSFFSKPLSLFIGAEAAGYFATILQPPTVFILPLMLAAYDIYAVFAGPLKSIAGKPAKSKKFLRRVNLDFLSLMLVDFNFVRIGLGDIIFYSMLPATGFMLFGIKKMLLTILATNLGIILTLFLIKEKKIILPGLPIPMLLGIIALLFL